MKHRINTRSALLVGLATLLAFVAYTYFSTHAFVKINVNTDSPAHFRLYWKSGEDTQYTEAQSTHIQIYPEKRYYTAVMGDLRNASELRISPSKNTHLFRITELSIYQSGINPIRFMGSKLKELKPIQGISQLSFDRHGLVYQPSFWDAYFETNLNIVAESDTLWTHIWRLLILFVLVALLARAYPILTQDLRYVPALMLLVFGFISVMSVISRPHAHPDEHAHLQAAQYYENHNTPPPACAEDSLHTYTNYGTSRLNTNELSYYISGKFLQLTDALPITHYIKLRAFNLVLFAILILLATFRPAARIVLLPMLMTPQVWYIFSYFNSDAFAIFCAMLIAYQVSTPDTRFKRLITGTSQYPAISFALLSLLCVFLFLTKKNFYFFALFLFGAALVFAWYRRNHLKRAFIAILGLLLVSSAAFGSWTYYQESIHGFERSARVLDCRDQTANYQYKPSTPLESSHPELNRKKRGEPITELLDDGWAKSVFMSSFGNYAYVSLPAGRPYYHLIALLICSAAAGLLFIAICRGNAIHRWLLAGFGSLFAMIIAITLYKSWTVDYQPQGRYYFALIPMAGALLGWMRSILNNRALSFFVFCLFALGVFSFLSIGLMEVRKAGY